MNTENKSTLMPHRPSRGEISRVALLAAYSRVGKRNHATADASLLSSNFTSSSLPIPLNELSSLDPSYRQLSPVDREVTTRMPPSTSATLRPLFKPRSPVFIAAFNVRTLKQIGQQAALARTLDTLSIDVCCISETRIQDPSTVLEIAAPASSARYKLRTSGDSEAAASGYGGVGIALSSRAEASLLDWIPVSSRICAVRLATTVRTRRRRKRNRSLFIVSVYAPTNCSADSTKDAFYEELNTLLSTTKSSDIVIVAGDLNAQVGRFGPSEARLGGMFSLNSKRTDNGDRLIQLCTDNQLFLSSTAFRRSGRRCATWRPPTSEQAWAQIDHIAISYRWRGSILDCRSFWNTYVDSDHALVRCRFSLTFTGKRNKQSNRLATEKLCEPEVKENYQTLLSEKLNVVSSVDVNVNWEEIRSAIHTAGNSACGVAKHQHNNHWISQQSLLLLEERRSIPSGSEHNSVRRSIRRQLKQSLLADREAWWNKVAQEMEEANAAGNARKLFQLIRKTAPKKATVSEVIKDNIGNLIYNKSQRLDRWAEHFQDQFSWPPASVPLSFIQPAQLERWTVSLEPPSVDEVLICLSALKRHRAAGPDDLPPALFKDGGISLCSSLVRLFKLIWEQEVAPDNWGESIIVPLFKKGVRTDCSNHRGISLTPVITRLLASIILRRLTSSREAQVREQQAGFRPGRGCIDHIFTLRQVLEQRHTYRRPTIAIFLDFKGAFDSVDRLALLDVLGQRGMPQKYVNILRALYSHTSGRVRVYGELSQSFVTTSGVRQGCPLSPFLFNFVIDVIMECTLEGMPNEGVEISLGERLVDLDYADDIVLLFDNPQSAQSILDKISEVVPCFGMRFSPAKCKVLLQDFQTPFTPLKLQGEELEVVDRFTYLGSCISHDCTVTDEVNARITKARVAFTNLRHLWRQKRISLKLKGRVYRTTVRAVLLYGCETWPLRAEDLRRLQIFDHRCIRSIAGVSWQQHIRNEEVRKRVLGNESPSLEQQIKLTRLRWLGHVLRMPNHRLPNKILFSTPNPCWRKARGGQSMTWQREMKAATTQLSVVGSARLPGWGPREPPCRWLETLQDMARNRSQWRACCHFLAGLSS